MGKTLYLECTSGISGDMTVAALLDLGASEQHLRETLATLPVHGFDVAVSRVTKSGLDACDFDVRLDAAHENHDHDMAWLYGNAGADEAEHAHEDEGHHHHEHEEHDHHDHACEGGHDGHCHGHDGEHAHGEMTCEHHHDAGHEHHHHHDEALACSRTHDEHHVHSHEHEHSHDGHDHAHGHHHEHRSFADVTAIINGSGLTERARSYALAVFAKLAEAEAKAHGATPETVHFHEVGAVDSIVDICSVAICLDDLDVTEIVVPALAEGHGTIRCAHGIMPVPVPAVVNLCQAAGIELVPAPVAGELVTPTGAAVVAALRTATTLPARYRILAIGYGAGKRPYSGCSGVLRAQLIEPVAGEGAAWDTAAATSVAATAPSESSGSAADVATEPVAPRGTCEPTSRGQVTKLETNLDDCTGEALGRVIELLMAAGARDAHAVPIVMKKGRPAYQLEVLCDEPQVRELERIIFENTTTIGIRSQVMRRDGLARTPGEVETPFGPVATKRVVLPSGEVRAYPEYDSVVAACERTGSSFQDVFRATQAAADSVR